LLVLFFITRTPPTSTLFPYTTLFRSSARKSSAHSYRGRRPHHNHLGVIVRGHVGRHTAGSKAIRRGSSASSAPGCRPTRDRRGRPRLRGHLHRLSRSPLLACSSPAGRVALRRRAATPPFAVTATSPQLGIDTSVTSEDTLTVVVGRL